MQENIIISNLGCRFPLVLLGFVNIRIQKFCKFFLDWSNLYDIWVWLLFAFLVNLLVSTFVIYWCNRFLLLTAKKYKIILLCPEFCCAILKLLMPTDLHLMTSKTIIMASLCSSVFIVFIALNYKSFTRNYKKSWITIMLEKIEPKNNISRRYLFLGSVSQSFIALNHKS